MCIYILSNQATFPSIYGTSLGHQVAPGFFATHYDFGTITKLLFNRFYDPRCHKNSATLILNIVQISYLYRRNETCSFSWHMDQLYADNKLYRSVQLTDAALGDGPTCRSYIPSQTVYLTWDNIAYEKNTIQMPCPSSVRWGHFFERGRYTAPWKSQHPRQLKISYIGSGNTPLKKRIIRFCHNNDDLCTLYDGDNGEYSSLQAQNFRRVWDISRSSTFCLSPPGLAPGRKQHIDSILMGCIPIFFFDSNTFKRYLPHHFGWRTNGSINISPGNFETFLTRRSIKFLLKQYGMIRRLQKSIRENGHSLVYSFEEQSGDAVDIFKQILNASV